MAIRVPDEGSLLDVKTIYGATAKPTSFTLQLFTDSSVLTDADTTASHTLATGGGYADKTLYPEGGSAPAATCSVVSGISQAAWPTQVFTFTGALTGSVSIKGYRILDNTGKVKAEELLPAPFTPATNGDHLDITPIIQFGNGTPT